MQHASGAASRPAQIDHIIPNLSPQASIESKSCRGRCVVCSVETIHGCRECRAVGTKLYICSREHQLLIWPLHQRVCGKRGFTWPALTKQEVAEMIEISSKPCRSLEGSPTTWLGTLKIRFKEVVPRVEDPVKALFFPLVFEKLLQTKLERSDGLPLPAIETAGLVELRSQAWQVRLRSTYSDREATFEESLKLLVQHPFDFLAHLETTRTPEGLAFNLENLPWWTEFQHRLICLLALISAASQLEKPSQEYFRIEVYRRNAYLETVRFCQLAVKASDPEIAEYLVSNVVTLLGLPFPIDARGEAG